MNEVAVALGSTPTSGAATTGVKSLGYADLGVSGYAIENGPGV